MNAEAAELCVRCGIPLTLREEPAPRPIDRQLNLDRRERPPPLSTTARHPAPEPAPIPAPLRAVPPRPRPAVQPSEPLPPEGATRTTRTAPPRVASVAVSAESRPARMPIMPDIPLDVGAVEVHLRRAPTWKRISSWAVDGSILGLFAVALFRLVLGTRSWNSTESGLDWFLEVTSRNSRILVPLAVVLLLAVFVYSTLGHALMGATLGKRLFRIQVVARDGRPPSLARSAVRSAFALIFSVALGLGPLLALFTRSGRALHDFLAGTYVVEPP